MVYILIRNFSEKTEISLNVIMDSVYLFIVLSLLLAYKTIDFICLREKIRQISSKLIMKPPKEMRFSDKRKILSSDVNKKKMYFSFAFFLNKVHEEFIITLMCLYIFILVILGYTEILIKYNTLSTTAYALVFSTACLTILISVTNYFIEKIKTNF